MSDQVKNLVGSWIPLSRTISEWSDDGGVRLEFYDNGTLGYVATEDGRIQVISLEYKVSGDKIITYQKESGEHATTFSISDNDVLVLLDDGMEKFYKRI
jgi:hypothetical protein